MNPQFGLSTYNHHADGSGVGVGQHGAADAGHAAAAGAA